MLLPGAKNVAEAKLGDRSFSVSVCRSSSNAASAQQEAPKLPFELLLKFPRYRSEGKKMSRLHKVDVTGTTGMVFPCAFVRAYVSFRPGEDSPVVPRAGRGQIGGPSIWRAGCDSRLSVRAAVRISLSPDRQSLACVQPLGLLGKTKRLLRD